MEIEEGNPEQETGAEVNPLAGKKIVLQTEFMITDVKPIYGAFMKRFAWLYNLLHLNTMVSGFEFMDVDAMWAFEDQEQQHLFELHANDLVTLANKTSWIVLNRVDAIDINKQEHHYLRMRLYNKSKYSFMRKNDINALHGEGKKIGEVNFNKE